MGAAPDRRPFASPNTIRTGRLDLRPVWGGDLEELVSLKADPRAFGLLLGGVRTRARATTELASDIAFWGRHQVGMWTVREHVTHRMVGITGIMSRPDGRGMSLRFALAPNEWGRGYASEAAGAALRFAHDRADLPRVIAVARSTNMASREVLGAIGMRRCGEFHQNDHRMLMFESLAYPIWEPRCHTRTLG